MANFTEKHAFQKLIHVAYGLGAALVIIGALFKLQHWSGAGLMLTVGMLTEFVIFILSALETMPKKYNWENVYPELELASQTKAANKTARGTTLQQQLDLNIDTTQVTGIKDGLSRLSESLKGLNSLAAVSQGSQQLAATLINANQAVSNVAHTSNALCETHVATAKIVSNYAAETQKGIEHSQKAMYAYGEQLNALNKNIGAINTSAEVQMTTLNKTMGAVNSAVDAQMATLNKTIGSVNSAVGSAIDVQMATLNKTIGNANSSIEIQLATVNKTIGAINSSFELQLNNLNKTIGNVTSSFELQIKDNQQYQQAYGLLNKEVVSLVADVKKSVQSTTDLSAQMKSLTENVSRLNSVYGNMLTAITNLR